MLGHMNCCREQCSHHNAPVSTDMLLTSDVCFEGKHYNWEVCEPLDSVSVPFLGMGLGREVSVLLLVMRLGQEVTVLFHGMRLGP